MTALDVELEQGSADGYAGSGTAILAILGYLFFLFAFVWISGAIGAKFRTRRNAWAALHFAALGFIVFRSVSPWHGVGQLIGPTIGLGFMLFVSFSMGLASIEADAKDRGDG